MRAVLHPAELLAVQLLAEASDKFAIHSGSIFLRTESVSDFIRTLRTVPRAATTFVWLIYIQQ